MSEHFEPAVAGRALLFATPSTWIEGEAVRQLSQAAERRGVTAVAGLPDLHPGKYGPVGTAVLSDGVLHPDLIGTDIGCGMSLFALDLAARRVRAEKVAARLHRLDDDWDDEAVRAGNANGFHTGHEVGLGTIGGGNHFCEVQAVHEIVDADEAAKAGIDRDLALLLVHSGSRSLGAAVFQRHWKGSRHGEDPGEDSAAYLSDHDEALRFASLNRLLVAARTADALGTESVPLLDVPHNFVEQVTAGLLHRKGAAPADRGLVPVPGSRGAFTYIVKPLIGDPRALATIAHGAGRKHDRRWMEARARGDRNAKARMAKSDVGSRVVCSDGNLFTEESPVAYKDIANVIGDLEAFGLVKVVAVTRPVVTFKTSKAGRGRK